MGVVWAAVQLVTRKPVALKVLRASHTHDKLLHQRFLREARAACAVRHPNVVEIHDVIVVEDDMPVMVMDLLEGESLGQRVTRERAIPLTELATIMLPVVSAVSSAHAIGIVHRDLKPDNIFLSRTATGTEIKVLDFGIAKLTASDGDAAATGGLTGTGTMLGTPFYMAPEQIYGEKDVDHRADIWAIGVILYECLAGVRPTQADSIGQILKVVTRDGIKPLGVVCPDLPPDILDLVARMLSPDREKRPSSLAEVTEVLARHTKEGQALEMRPRPPLGTNTGPSAAAFEPLGDAATIHAAPPATLSSTTTTVGGGATAAPRRATLAFIGVAAVAAVGLAVFFGVRASGSTPDPSPGSSATPSALVHADPGPTVVTTTPAALPTSAERLPVASATAMPTPTARRPDPTAKPTASAAVPKASAAAAATTNSPGGVVDKPPF